MLFGWKYYIKIDPGCVVPKRLLKIQKSSVLNNKIITLHPPSESTDRQSFAIQFLPS